MTLHVKTIRVNGHDRTVLAALQVALTTKNEVVLQMYLTATPTRKGGREAFMGVADVNRAGELCNAPEDLADGERRDVEAALRAALT